MADEESLEERVSRNLDRTGFPFEISTARIFEQVGWEIFRQGFYEDFENKPNTIDIAATRLRKYEQGILPRRLTISMIIECKKRIAEKPWAFYISRPFSDIDLAPIQFVLRSFYELEEKDSYSVARRSHYFDVQNLYSVLAVEPFTNGANTEINKAIRQVAAATLYTKNSTEKRLSRLKLDLLKGGLMIQYPVIVFDGTLIAIKDDGGGKFSLSKVNHVTHAYHSADESMFIDVVTKEYVETFAKRVLQEFGPIESK